MSKSKEYIIELLKDKYEYEFKRKQYFDDSLGMPVTLLSFLVAGIYVVITDESTNNLVDWLLIVKWALIGLLLFAALATIYFLFRVYFGIKRTYSSFPESKHILDNDFKNLVDYHSDIENIEERESKIVEDLKNYTIKWYSDCNEENTDRNDQRADFFFYARISLGISLAIGIFLLFFICISKTDMAQKPPPPPPTPVRREKSDTPVLKPKTQGKKHE